MVAITYVEFGGDTHVVDVATGTTVMAGAVAHGVHGIDAECGGSCACATCHVYVDDAWRERVGPPEGTEKDLLEFVSRRRANSRLSCQIIVDERLDGLVVRLPESQKE